MDDLVKNEKAEFEALARATRKNTRCGNTLAEPSHCVNALSTPTAPTTSNSCLVLPKLLETERRLIYDNEGCLKCRRVYVDHRLLNCPNNFPNLAMYKTLTQSFVDMIKSRVKKPVAAVISSDSTSVPTISVAAVMGSSMNPVAYMPTNASSIMEGVSDDNKSVSAVTPVAATVPAPSLREALSDQLAPLLVPHLFWRCSTSGAPNTLPVTIEVLIDPGSHLVLINETFAELLALKRRKLLEPLPIEMAIPGKNRKIVTILTDWVKLRLYDPSGLWTARTVHAVIAPSLCAPVILGMPFLSHNHIIVDVASRTVIDKVADFDLLNPSKQPPLK
jgi:hypothetical protein